MEEQWKVFRNKKDKKHPYASVLEAGEACHI